MNMSFQHTRPLRGLYLPVITMLLMIASGCKPTERNYQAAYDAALAKRQTALQDMDIPAEGLMEDGEPFLKDMGQGRRLYYLVAPMAPVSEGSLAGDKYNVVVGCYKMPVNALDQARKLREDGLDSFATRGEQDRFYVVAATFETLPEAIAFYDDFLASRPGYPIVGFPGLTIVENTRVH